MIKRDWLMFGKILEVPPFDTKAFAERLAEFERGLKKPEGAIGKIHDCFIIDSLVEKEDV